MERNRKLFSKPKTKVAVRKGKARYAQEEFRNK